MHTHLHPTDLAISLLKRSTCRVQVAAVLVDQQSRVFSWGWNSSGRDGYGEHAEVASLRRANRHWTQGATLYVAAKRSRNGRPVTARPCESCLTALSGVKVVWRNASGEWEEERFEG